MTSAHYDKVPPELTELLNKFTLSYVKERPTDLYKFAAEYF